MIKDEYCLVWEDSFDREGMPDPEKWNCVVSGGGFGNHELQFYTAEPENVCVEGGKLRITARKQERDGHAYTSAKLTTAGKADWQYGKVQVRAKLPKGKGSWPAIWMMPNDCRGDADWPLCGEIDIMEHVGWDQNRVHATIHSGLYNHRRKTQRSSSVVLEDVSGVFHDYELEWTPEAMRFRYDGAEIACFYREEPGFETGNTGWPFDKPFYLILNVAVGGDWGGEVEAEALPFTMEVESVRVSQKKV